MTTMFRERPKNNNNRNERRIAGAHLFLASDLPAYVTEAVINVKGEMLIHG